MMAMNASPTISHCRMPIRCVTILSAPPPYRTTMSQRKPRWSSGGGCGRFPDDDLVAEASFPFGGGVEQLVRGGGGHRTDRLAHRGQRRPHRLRERGIVETSDRQPFGHRNAPAMR